MDTNSALQRAVDIAGGQVALATKIGVSQGTLWHWLKRSKKGAPAEHVAAIERATNGVVKCHDLRPDVFQKSGKAA